MKNITYEEEKAIALYLMDNAYQGLRIYFHNIWLSDNASQYNYNEPRYYEVDFDAKQNGYSIYNQNFSIKESIIKNYMKPNKEAIIGFRP